MRQDCQGFYEYRDARMKDGQIGPCAGHLLPDKPPRHSVADSTDSLLRAVVLWVTGLGAGGSSRLGPLRKWPSAWLKLESPKSSTIRPRWRTHSHGWELGRLSQSLHVAPLCGSGSSQPGSWNPAAKVTRDRKRPLPVSQSPSLFRGNTNLRDKWMCTSG